MRGQIRMMTDELRCRTLEAVKRFYEVKECKCEEMLTKGDLIDLVVSDPTDDSIRFVSIVYRNTDFKEVTNDELNKIRSDWEKEVIEWLTNHSDIDNHPIHGDVVQVIKIAEDKAIIRVDVNAMARRPDNNGSC